MMSFKVGDEVRVNQPTNLFHSELGKVVSIDHVKLTYKVIFHRGGSDVYTCFDLILVKRQEETTMKFRVGDRVQVVATYSAFCGDKGNVIDDDGTDILPIKVSFDGGEHECWFYEDGLKVLHEEETRVKFKVGDKVKVSNSWEGRSGEVGQIVTINVYNEFTHEVRFGDMFSEHFREEELELVKEKAEKQSFTKSDLKTGMGVVLRNGSRAHVLLGTDDGDVIRFLAEGGKWGSLSELDEQLYDKDGNQFDIVEVYSTTYSNLYMTDKVFDEKLVFKREEPKPKPKPEPIKMTMKEINEHFGKAIEIIE